MHSLPIFVRLAGRPVILIGDGEAADAKRRLLQRAGAEIVGEEDNASLAIVATDDDAEAKAAAARLRARGVLVNATDRPELCDFTLPAIVDRDPVLIAIGTDGASAGLAKALRQRLEAILPATLGALADRLRAAREAMRAKWPDADMRRRAIDASLSEGGPLDPLCDPGAAPVDRWLAGDDFESASGVRTIVVTSDDPDQLTIEAARLIGLADAILHDPQVAPEILDRARADAGRIANPDAPVSPDGLTIRLLREKGR